MKVVPYSWGAATPLSNFEANQDYRDVEDPSITVRFTVTDPDGGPAQEGDQLLIWTTTPWTLPGNLGIAVGTDLDYVRVKNDGEHLWVAEALKDAVVGEDAEIVATAKGEDLLGTSYAPPFPHFEDHRSEGVFRVIPSSDVTTDEGTGLVHMAPAFGEADLAAFREAGIDTLVDPVAADGSFTDAV